MTWLLIWLLAWLALSLLAAVAFGKLLRWCNGEADDINAHVAADPPPGYDDPPVGLFSRQARHRRGQRWRLAVRS